MGTVTDADLLSELEMFGVDDVKTECMSKMKELCLTYGCDAEQFSCDWIAFTSRKSVGPADITLQLLEDLEREELSQKRLKPEVHTPVAKKPAPKVFNVKEERDVQDYDMGDDVLESYGMSSELLKKRQRTPDTRISKRLMDSSGSPSIVFSPASFSPKSLTASAKYTSRTTSGDVVAYLRQQETVDWKCRSSEEICTQLLQPGSIVTKNVLYMFEQNLDKAAALNAIAGDYADMYQEDMGGEQFVNIKSIFQESSYVTGRVYCDSLGKMNATSLILEGGDSSNGNWVPLNISNLKQYSFFSGQVIAGKGINPTGQAVVLEELLEGKIPPFPKAPPELKEPLHIVIACGPYTTTEDLSFQPMTDFINYITEHKPQVCIMAGPFIDSRHELIQKGNLPESYDTIFQKQVQTLASILENTKTKIVLIPSQRDVHHDCVYPTPPFRLDRTYKNVLCAPDPCILDINGFVIGMTAVDVLFHLGKEEISPPGASDRLSRLAKHVLTQHCFYPLYPASEDVGLDCTLLEDSGRFSTTPHLLVLPSDLRSFVKDIHGCICVNPERVTKGIVGGTFARAVVNPVSASSYQGSMAQNVSVEVVKI
ncbi:DNA polymerase alpha subunit B-like [Ornithodoros turicata]|uniref:DNA polymerase alpha subunit B-like n=1 Tax=Ornithodoros turicata TaxID=34597 RepID=UPI00313A107C